MARLHPRRQLEQWHECWGIHVESEQYADEYQYQHWVSRRQELQVPPEAGYTGFWLQEWWLTMVAASVHDDLPFALSQPSRTTGSAARWLNMIAGGEYSASAELCPQRFLKGGVVNKLIVFRKAWEYLFWLRPTVERFVKVHKYSLGIELQASALRLLRLVIRANYAELKAPIISEAIIEHEIQRVFLRLAFEHKLLSKRQFEFGSAKLDEIGRLLHGWHRQCHGRQR